MKSKKKFLLLGVGVMGALALGVGATSTFAWFTVTTTANVKQASSSESITLASSTAKSSTIKFTVAPATNSVQLDLTADDGKAYYYDPATEQPVEYSPAAALCAVVTYNVTVALDASATNQTTFQQAYMTMYDTTPIILLKVTVGQDVRADTVHTTTATHDFTTVAGTDIFYRLTEKSVAAADSSASDSLTFTVSIKGHDGGEAFANAGALYDTGISVAVGSATAADGTGFEAFAS